MGLWVLDLLMLGSPTDLMEGGQFAVLYQSSTCTAPANTVKDMIKGREGIIIKAIHNLLVYEGM